MTTTVWTNQKSGGGGARVVVAGHRTITSSASSKLSTFTGIGGYGKTSSSQERHRHIKLGKIRVSFLISIQLQYDHSTSPCNEFD